jgi:hypothetical protein
MEPSAGLHPFECLKGKFSSQIPAELPNRTTPLGPLQEPAVASGCSFWM